MGRSSSAKAARASAGPAPRSTHEPAVPVNWPEGHVSSEVTDPEDDECIVVTIHGVRHSLHSSTAQALVGSLVRTLQGWEAAATAHLGGSPPLWEYMDGYLAGLRDENPRAKA